MRFYYLEMVGTAVFAITGVLAVNRRGLDVIGAVVLGIVTAIGGGTVRDLIIGVPPFWMADFNYVWAALAGALVAFAIGSALRNVSRGLLYLDAIGAALFAVSAVNKVLMLSNNGPVAVTMGVLTAIGGGLIRDALAGRETLLMSRDIYATPILLGCIVFVSIRTSMPAFQYAGLLGFLIILGVRALAIYRHLQMPLWLTTRDDGSRETANQ